MPLIRKQLIAEQKTSCTLLLNITCAFALAYVLHQLEYTQLQIICNLTQTAPKIYWIMLSDGCSDFAL